MRPSSYVSPFPAASSLEVLVSRAGARCERRLFPSTAFVRSFIDEVVAPLPNRQRRLAEPGGLSPWAAPFNDVVDRQRVGAAFDMVCSSLSATFAETELRGGYSLAKTVPIPEGVGGFCRRAVFAPVVRYLPVSAQQSYSIVDVDFRNGPSRPGLLLIYGTTRRLRIEYELPIVTIYTSTFGHEVNPIIARASPRHPLVAAARTGPISQLLQMLVPQAGFTENSRGAVNRTVAQSFAFPLNLGVADEIDCPLLVWASVGDAAEDEGIDLQAELPFLGLPIAARERLVSLAEEFDALAEAARGRPVRRALRTALWVAVVFGLLGPFAAVTAASVAALSAELRRRLRVFAETWAEGLRLAAAFTPEGGFARNTTAATAIAILLYTTSTNTSLAGVPFRDLAIRLRARASISSALTARIQAQASYPPSEPIPAFGALPGLPPNRTHVPTIHLAPRHLRYPFVGYEPLTPGTEVTEFSRALSPALQFRDTLNVSMELYQQTLNLESAWLAVSPAAQSQGALAVALATAADPISRQLVALRELFGSVPQSRVIAFIWRQVIVDNFLAAHRRFVARVAEGGTLSGRIDVLCDDSVLYNTFCWMRRASDREVLDRVLGPVVASSEPRRSTRALEVGIFGRVFSAATDDADETPLLTALSRFDALPCEDRCDVWPRFLELAAQDPVCTNYEAARPGTNPFEPVEPDPDWPDPEVDDRSWERQAPGWQGPLVPSGGGGLGPFAATPSPGWVAAEAPRMYAGVAPGWH